MNTEDLDHLAWLRRRLAVSEEELGEMRASSAPPSAIAELVASNDIRAAEIARLEVALAAAVDGAVEAVRALVDAMIARAIAVEEYEAAERSLRRSTDERIALLEAIDAAEALVKQRRAALMGVPA